MIPRYSFDTLALRRSLTAVDFCLYNCWFFSCEMCLENIYASIVRAKCDMHAHHEGVLKSLAGSCPRTESKESKAFLDQNNCHLTTKIGLSVDKETTQITPFLSSLHLWSWWISNGILLFSPAHLLEAGWMRAMGDTPSYSELALSPSFFH